MMELPDLPISANCVRVPAMVGHAEPVRIETESRLTPTRRRHFSARRRASPRRFPVPGEGEGGGRGPRWPDPPGSDRVERARPLPRLRQPSQRRGAERDPDRRAPGWLGCLGTPMAAARAPASALLQRPEDPCRHPFGHETAPSSSRASSTRPCARKVRNPKSARKSDGNRSGGRGSARRSTRPRHTDTRTPPAPSHRGPSVPDRGQEERLHHPRRGRVDHVGAGDEHRFRRRRPRREPRGAREQPGRPVRLEPTAARRRRSRPCPRHPIPPPPSGSSGACRRCAGPPPPLFHCGRPDGAVSRLAPKSPGHFSQPSGAGGADLVHDDVDPGRLHVGYPPGARACTRSRPSRKSLRRQAHLDLDPGRRPQPRSGQGGASAGGCPRSECTPVASS